MQQRVLPDANVLYPRTTRTWLCLIEAAGGPYTTYWTEDVLAEALYHLRRNHPTWDGGKTRHVRDALVESLGVRVEDYTVDGTFVGDPNDQHVHAAALACEAHVLLTADAGFTASATAGADALPYEVYQPDDFFVLVDDSVPHLVERVAHQQINHAGARGVSADLPRALRAAGCPVFADRVRAHVQRLALRR